MEQQAVTMYEKDEWTDYWPSDQDFRDMVAMYQDLLDQEVKLQTIITQ